MGLDLLIRGVFGALVVLLAGVQILQRVKASRFERRTEPSSEGRSVGEIAVFSAMPLWATSALVYPFAPTWLSISLTFPTWLRATGLFMMAVSLPLSIMVFQALGKNFSAKLELFDEHQLVSNGPYRVVRHPMYSVFMLCALGSSLASGSLMVIAASTTACAVLLVRIRREEQMLFRRFGRAYDEYSQRTGAVVPRVAVSVGLASAGRR